MAFAGAGVLLLTYSGSFITPGTLKFFGLPLFGVSIFLISFGLLPYRRLTYLESHPNSLSIEGEEFLHFQENETPIFSIPLDQIEALGYFEKGDDYGITVSLKVKDVKSILLHAHSFSIEKFGKLSKKKTDADFFFPFFSRRTYARLGGLSCKRNVAPLQM